MPHICPDEILAFMMAIPVIRVAFVNLRTRFFSRKECTNG